jgi:hypothetical protein
MLPGPLDLVTPKNHRVGRPWRVAPNTTATGPLLFGIAFRCVLSSELPSNRVNSHTSPAPSISALSRTRVEV